MQNTFFKDLFLSLRRFVWLPKQENLKKKVKGSAKTRAKKNWKIRRKWKFNTQRNANILKQNKNQKEF